MSGPRLDEELRTALDRYGLSDRVHLVVGDSRTADSAAAVRARLRRRRPHLRGRPRRLRALARAGRTRRRHPLPRRSRRGRNRNDYPGDRASGGGDRTRRHRPRAAAERRLDRTLHASRLMRLVAVVLSCNGREDTLAALESLRGIETVVVDNGSADGRRAVANDSPRSSSSGGVNLGFAGGNNVGIRRALDRGAEWVLLVNNDAMASRASSRRWRSGGGAARCGRARVQGLFADSDRLWYAGAGFDPILGGAGTRASASPMRRGARRTRAARPAQRWPSRAPRSTPACSTRSSSSMPRISSGACASARRVRGRLRAGGEGAAQRLRRHRRCRLADDELLRDAQHARRRRALPAAAPRLTGSAAGSSSRRASARGTPAGVGGRRCAAARLPPRADGPPLASRPWRTSAAASTPRPRAAARGGRLRRE